MSKEPVSRMAYRVREVAQLLSISPRTVQSRIKDGALKSVLIGRVRLIPAEAIADFLGERQ